ncbi:MAG TPA: hypothetical protein VNI81_14035 [Candidatus Limnocylindrales bacterium]|nr:hypothetical protein [Candidatus Limnocylindrales bacterium]
MSETASKPAQHESNAPLRPQSDLDSIPASRTGQLQHHLHPRRNPHSWFAFRLFLGFLGAALVLLPLALPQSWLASIFGLAIFLTSILLPPLSEQTSEPQLSRPLAGQLVLTGAEFSSGGALRIPVRLYVNSEQVLAMKPDLQPAVVVPIALLSCLFLQRTEHSWLLILESPGNETVFSFRGIFAERNARRAESRIRRFVRLTPPVKPKARAATA